MTVRNKSLAAGMFLVGLLTFALYFQTRNFEHVRLDDGLYTALNPDVARGLTLESVRWAFTNRDTANWQPVTWLSLLGDVAWFGPGMGAMHLHNAALHAVNAALFFWLLALLAQRTRPSRWPVVHGAAALAALFWALHPLRVESVAWISSRKDVLSGFFCLVGLIAWERNVSAYYGDTPRYAGWSLKEILFAPAPAGARSDRGSGALVCGCFILGYMAKPTMMIFPGLLALMEWLKTGRVRWKPVAGLLAVAFGFGVLTVFAQKVAIDTKIPLLRRINNGVVAYAIYWWKTAFPYDLCIFYPNGWTLLRQNIVAGYGFVVATWIVTVIAWRRVPVVAFMAGWFVCALVPVIGIFVHVGLASHADRYTYLTTLGVSMALAAGLVWTAERWRWRAAPVFVLLLVAEGCHVRMSDAYIKTWKNNFTVWQQALFVVPDNSKAWQQLATEYESRFKDMDKTIACSRKALRFHDTDENAGLLSLALAKRGKPGDFEEVKALTQKVADHPELDDIGHALTALGIVAMRELRWEDAIRYFSGPARDKPTPELYLWLGMSLYHVGRYKEAAEHFKDVAETAPEENDRRAGQARLAYLVQKQGDVLKDRPGMSPSQTKNKFKRRPDE
jgi:hypothetical protein